MIRQALLIAALALTGAGCCKFCSDVKAAAADANAQCAEWECKYDNTDTPRWCECIAD